MFKIGDKVKYVSGRHGHNEHINPLWQKSKVTGVVVNIYPERNALDYRVKWESGEKNGYFKEDLELVNTFKKEVAENYEI